MSRLLNMRWPTMADVREKSAELESPTPSPITAQPARVTPDTPKSISRVAVRQMGRFLDFLRDCYVDLYRESQDIEPEDVPDERLCRMGCGRLAMVRGECFSCAHTSEVA